MIVDADSELGRRAQDAVFPKNPGLLMRLVDGDSCQHPPLTTTYLLRSWEQHFDGTLTIVWERAWWEL